MSIAYVIFAKISIVYFYENERTIDMETIAEIFGKRVRSLRKQRGLSQEKLSELCDLHPTYIGQIERGEKNASLETIMSLCKGLDVPPSLLFENIGASGEKTIPGDIYDIIIEMSENEQKAVYDIIKSIKAIINSL